MSKIKTIKARELLDSRGNPTLEVDVILENNILGRAIVPSGASTGKKEAVELRDGDKKRYNGMGILKAIESVKQIANEIIGHEVTDLKKIDQLMILLDGTHNKAKLGANAILGVSMAAAKAAANFEHLPLYRYLSPQKNYQMPVPLMNVINGGAHANNKLDIQEFMICPVSFPSIKEAIRAGAEISRGLKEILLNKNYSTNVGDEGGFAPNLEDSYQALDLIMLAIEKAGYKPGEEIFLALDVAASELYSNGVYNLKTTKNSLDGDELIAFYKDLVKKYPIFSIEDPLAENDLASWKTITEKLGNKVQLVGDDIFVTNPAIFSEAINMDIANSILVKPNQIGTLLETHETIEMAKKNSYKTIMSHRSGETEDTTIAHLAVGYDTRQIKAGGLSRTDRLAKYNELIRIEEDCQNHSNYVGKEIIKTKN